MTTVYECINYFSVAVVRHHNQSKRKKGRVYFDLWFQRESMMAEWRPGNKAQVWWQEQEAESLYPQLQAELRQQTRKGVNPPKPP